VSTGLKMVSTYINTSTAHTNPSDANNVSDIETQNNFLARWLSWQSVCTILIAVVIYDQGTFPSSDISDTKTDTERSFPVMYQVQKGSIAGPKFKIPLMGPFVQALHPKFDAYLAQWASGPLSCVSVFHKYVKESSTRFWIISTIPIFLFHTIVSVSPVYPRTYGTPLH
jgi:C-22 sterol desaturase